MLLMTFSPMPMNMSACEHSGSALILFHINELRGLLAKAKAPLTSRFKVGR